MLVEEIREYGTGEKYSGKDEKFFLFEEDLREPRPNLERVVQEETEETGDERGFGPVRWNPAYHSEMRNRKKEKRQPKKEE